FVFFFFFFFFFFKKTSCIIFFFFFSSRRRHTRYWRDWSSDVCSSDLPRVRVGHQPAESPHLGILPRAGNGRGGCRSLGRLLRSRGLWARLSRKPRDQQVNDQNCQPQREQYENNQIECRSFDEKSSSKPHQRGIDQKSQDRDDQS